MEARPFKKPPSALGRRRRAATGLTHQRPEKRHAGVGVEDIGLRRPTLDDVFLALTGHAAEAENGEEEKEAA